MDEDPRAPVVGAPLTGAIFLASFATLFFEVALARAFSYSQWPALASVVIGLALLGSGASGSVLAVMREADARRDELRILGFLALFPLTLCAGSAVLSLVFVNPFRLGTSVAELLPLAASLLAAGLPFFASSAAVGLALARYPAGRIYQVNLLGAGAGALAVTLLAFRLHPATLLAVAAAAAVAAPAWHAWRFGRWVALAAIAAAALLWGAFAATVGRPGAAGMSPYKPLSRAMTLPAAEIIARRPTIFGVVEQVRARGLRAAGDVSLVSPGTVPEQDLLFFDGDSPSPVIPWASSLHPLRYLGDTPSALPHRLLGNAERRAALVVGLGGGEGAARALLHGFSRVEVLEMNGAVTELVGASPEGVLSDPRTIVWPAEARGFLARGDDGYDLIEIPLMESYSSSAGGIRALSENYLFTREAFAAALSRLTDRGVLGVTRWNTTPPRDGIRLLSLAAAALRDVGAADPGRHVVAVRSMRSFALAISRSPLTGERIARAREFADSLLFDLVWLPGMKEDEANRRIVMTPPLYEEAARAMLAGDAGRFIRDYPFDVSVPTDARPYYDNPAKAATAPVLLRLGPQAVPVTQWGALLLALALVPAAAASAILILLPLALVPFPRTRRGGTFLVFAALGAGFFCVELPLISRFVLVLHHPASALGVVVASLLVFSGVGSRLSGRIFPGERGPGLSALVVAGAVILYAAVLPWAAARLAPRPPLVAVPLVVLLLAPLGFLMGMPFPLAVTRAKGLGPGMVPWAWGINGFFSVMGTFGAGLLAVGAGQTAVLAAAALCYLAAGLAGIGRGPA